MSESDNERRTSGAPASWLKSNLAALGSAAVFTVYSAGFVRTRAAAAEFSDAPIMRRAGTAHPIGLRPVASRPSPRQAAPAPTAPAEAAATETKPVGHAPEPIVDAHTTAAARRVASAAAPSASAAPKAPASVPQSAVASTAKTSAATPAATSIATPAATPATAPSAQPSVTATVAAPAQPVQTAATAPSSAPAPAPAPASTSTAAPAPSTAPAHQALAADDPARGSYKDGTYLGWGTSRHGDIQVKLVVQDGWIVSATIAQCLTQYACSWIDQLPPEVTARQSPDVDYVSGATQSSNAFYGAVQQAIAKAQK